MATVNPLNDFNTFSYHHFLVLVNSTQAADDLKDDNLFFRFANGEAVVEGAKIIVNPIKSLRYIIQDLTWTNWLAMNPEEFGGTIGSGGEFRIIEPNGMSFLNDLFLAFGELGCGASTSQWVLKTIFVGQTDVGGYSASGVEYINNINPLLMVMVNMDATFSEAGGEYTFEFVAAGQGAGLTPAAGGRIFAQRTNVNLAGSDTPGAVTLEQGLKALEKHLNETANESNKKIDDIRAIQGANYPAPFKSKHVIVIPDSLKRPEYVIKSPARTGAGPDGSAPYLSVSPNMGVVPGIQAVINMCVPLMISCQTPGQLREYYVNSTETLDNATQTKTFYHTIVERPIEPIKDPASKDGGTNTGAVPPAEQKAIDSGNFLEFDYLYTGKNIDVLEFEMKLGSGLAFLEAMVGLSAIKDNRADATVATNIVSTSNTKEVGSNSAVPMGTVKLPDHRVAHRTNPSAVAAYNQLMQQHSVLNVMTTIKIRGNPRLLNDVTPTITATGDTTQNRTSMGTAANYGTQPVRCRVNVRMPKDGDLDSLEDFWYKGSYLILSVKNEFSGGEFTQELQMVAEMDGEFKNVPEQPKQKPKESPVPTAIVGETSEVAARIRAFLSAIRYSEGTDGPNGYTTIFSGVQFSDFSDHPRQVIVTPKYESSAAGAYQIRQATWDWISSPPSKYSSLLPNFEPATQDVAAWCLLDYRGALPYIRSNDIQGAVNACKLEWASLPGSTYGQPTKKLEQFMNVYNNYLQQEMNGLTILKAPTEVFV